MAAEFEIDSPFVIADEAEGTCSRIMPAAEATR